MRVLKAALAAALILALAVPVGASANPSRPHGAREDLVAGSQIQHRDEREPRTRPRPKVEFARPTFEPKTPTSSGSSTSGGAVVIGVEAGKAASVASRLRAAGWTIQRTSRNGERLLAVPPALGSAVAIGAAEAMSGVSYAEVSRRVQVMWTPADPEFDAQWGLARIGAANAWDVTRGSAEVTIAVIDTGVDLGHADLASRVDTAHDFDFVNQDTSARDDMGHGTHVAGIVAASTNDACGLGLAPEATILPIKALDSDGWGSDFDIADAIEYAADHDASVVNMSFGTWWATQPLVDAVEYARAKGVVLVAAAGNWGEGDVFYPAALPGVIAVGATTRADTMADFSGSGPELDLVAPGTGILSTKRGGGMMQASGTSMSSPFVAGAAALVLSQNPALTAEEVEDRLESTARDLGQAGKDIRFGSGRLNVANALGQPGGDGTEVLAPSDDDMPGIEATSSPVLGTLDSDADPEDVRRIHLEAGERLSLSFSGATGTRFFALLFSPDAESIYSSWPMMYPYPYSYPQKMTYTAPRAGDFYVMFSASDGAGAYTLDWAVSTPSPTDNELPGLALPGSPAVGSLRWFRDDMDVYRVHLEKGQRFAMRLAESPGFGYEAMLYGPDTWSIADGMWYDGDEGDVIDWQYSGVGEGIAHTAEKAGDYYVVLQTPVNGWGVEEADPEFIEDFERWYGKPMSLSGQYRCEWRVFDPGPDSEIPGVELTSTPVVGFLDNPMDTDDVRRIHVEEGQRLNVQMDSSKTLHGDLYLYSDPSTSTISGRPLAMSCGYDGTSAFSYVASSSRDYYVDASAFWGTAGYRMKWSVNNAVQPELSATPPSAAPAYGATTDISVMATDTLSSTPATDLAVDLEVYDDRWDEWWPECSILTDAEGRAVVPTSQTYKTTYRIASYHGTELIAAGDPFTIKPRAFLAKPMPTTTVKAGRSSVFAGVLKPRHTRGKSSVNILCYRRSSTGRWVFKRSVRTANYNWYSATQYRARFTLSPGTWKLVAEAPEDLGHARTVTRPRIVLVK